MTRRGWFIRNAAIVAVVIAVTAFLTACGPGISSLIDTTLTTGEAGLEEYSKRKAAALSRAPCHIDQIGMATLSTTKQWAIRLLCQPEAAPPMTAQ